MEENLIFQLPTTTKYLSILQLQLWREAWVWNPSRTPDGFAIVVIVARIPTVKLLPPHCLLVNATSIIGGIDWGSATYFFSSRLVRIANFIKQNWLNNFVITFYGMQYEKSWSRLSGKFFINIWTWRWRFLLTTRYIVRLSVAILRVYSVRL
jgi:hypothetical protein